jgi:hypothetical protein
MFPTTVTYKSVKVAIKMAPNSLALDLRLEVQLNAVVQTVAEVIIAEVHQTEKYVTVSVIRNRKVTESNI